MKKIAVALGVSALLLSPGFAVAKDKTYTGEIMDNQCAKVGSHEAMMKKAGLTSKADCAKACVKMGGKYVLYHAATKTIYELDDQSKLEEFAGKDVKVTGELDKATKTIHVTGIKAA